MKKQIDETFIQRWLNKELTINELEEFEKTSDYLLYQKIMEVSSGFEAPDFNKDKVFGEINQKLKKVQKSSKKTKVINVNWMVSVAAASVILLLGIFYYLDLPVNHKTGYGEQLAIMLPDSSEVVLNSKSSIRYESKNWEKSSELTLKGEAFFKVKKGKTFRVITDLGDVKVLGTQFDVQTNQDYVEVKCFEGKVSVTSNQKENILTKGQATRSFKEGESENWEVQEQEPKWKNGESTFRSIALKYVILSIENQYDIDIKAKGIDLKQKFTGSYTHNNLKIALKTVFEPMKIGVIFTDKKTVTLVKQ